MKIPILKEYGAWAVFIFSCAAGIITGLLTKPWHDGRDVSVAILLTVLGLVLLINTKNPFLSLIRTKGQTREHLLWFMFFCIGGFSLLIPFLAGGIKTFLLFTPLILGYAILLSSGREHLFLAELSGFGLLALSAPIIYFVITGEMSFRLYLAVLIFFAAGVFKVRALIKKTFLYRCLMVFYCAAALVFFFYINVSAVMLLPFIENIVSVLRMKEERLRTTGNKELIKGFIFTVLLGFFWH
ncbi:MAG: YwiC-like family protein [Nitrospirota bacterium]